MAAKGTASKQIIFDKILATFDGAFSPDGKELRVPLMENGEEVQIKIALTCAKDNISHAGGATTTPQTSAPAFPSVSAPVAEMVEPTAEEKQRIEELLSMF